MLLLVSSGINLSVYESTHPAAAPGYASKLGCYGQHAKPFSPAPCHALRSPLAFTPLHLPHPTLHTKCSLVPHVKPTSAWKGLRGNLLVEISPELPTSGSLPLPLTQLVPGTVGHLVGMRHCGMPILTGSCSISIPFSALFSFFFSLDMSFLSAASYNLAPSLFSLHFPPVYFTPLVTQS